MRIKFAIKLYLNIKYAYILYYRIKKKCAAQCIFY